MRSNILRRNRGITHSLTPILFNNQRTQLQNYDINIQLPIPQKLSQTSNNKSHYTNHLTQRSRKHRLLQQRNTQIQKNNRMLYERINKIMAKNKKETLEVEKQENINDLNQTSFKPLSLPQVYNERFTFLQTKTQLSHILSDRKTYADKYFKALQLARLNMGKAQQIGNFQFFGWKIKALMINNGQHITLVGKKGKKQIKKKYIYQRVKIKIQQTSLKQWVQSKFEFQL